MRVVILYNTSWYVYLLRRNLIASLREAGCEVIVVAPRDNYTARLIKLGVRHVSIPLDPGSTSPLKELSTLRCVFQTLRSLKPDAVLSFTIKCNLYAGLCRHLLPFKQIANISGLGVAFDQKGLALTAIKKLYRFALKETDHIFFQNGDDLRNCVQQNLVTARKTRLIPGSGVDLAAFTPSPRKGANLRTFLMFGRLLPQKGYDLYLKAAATLRQEFGDRVAFWVLGSPDFQRTESLELLERINVAHAEGTIRYLQSSDDVRPFLRESDVVVLPSTYNEGIPRSLLEALASGKSIITTDWKGCRETVEHKVNGYLVQPNDQDSLTDAMREMIICPDSTLEAFGKASRARAEQLFDERVVLDAYREALRLPVPSDATDIHMRPTGTESF